MSTTTTKKNISENQTKYIDLHSVKQQNPNAKIQYSSKSAMSRKTSKDSLHETKKESNTEVTPVGKSLMGFGDPNSRIRTASGKQLNVNNNNNNNNNIKPESQPQVANSN